MLPPLWQTEQLFKKIVSPFSKEKELAYQVLNGKNGMPAFGGRLKESEIEAVAIYVLEESSKDFKN